MKHSFMILILFIACFNGYTQIVFENGYFINDNNQRIDCLIKNVDWIYNPSEFEYKLSETSEPQPASIQFVKEFGILTDAKYIRASVGIDRSSEVLSKITAARNPDLHEETLFLKVLVEGKASLFVYKERGLVRFFYQIDDSDIKQLIFKAYLIERFKVGYNNQFRQQLQNDLKCTYIPEVSNLDYYQNDLERFFIKYNSCQNTDYISFGNRNRKELINLSIRPGVNYNNLVIHNTISDLIDFGSSPGYRIGIELELIMPFNKDKWAVLLEPTYQNYNAQKDFKRRNVVVHYQSLELPVGVRYYLYLHDRSKVFINSSFVWDFSFDSGFTGRVLEISTLGNFAFGVGYKYNDRFSLELRYLTGRNLLVKYIYWGSAFQTTSFIVGYTLF